MRIVAKEIVKFPSPTNDLHLKSFLFEMIKDFQKYANQDFNQEKTPY